MSDIRVERKIAAPPDVVWALVADVCRMGEWSPENVGGEWLGSDTSAVKGARFKGNNRNDKKKWSTTCTITEAEPGRSLVFDVKAGPFNIARWAYRIEAVDGGCLVTETWTDRRPGLMKPMGKLASGVGDREAHNRTGMEITLERLAAAAERATSS